MSRKYLGLPFDIHGGGADLVFPHHENEVAQSEAACGCTFANYWIHGGMLQINSEKMSKSLGNFLLLRDVLERTRPEVLRFLMLQTHYRAPLDFSFERLEGVAGTLERFGECSFFARAAKRAGIPFYELAGLERWSEYLEMGEADVAVTINPAARQAGKMLAERLGMRWLELPLSYDEAEIDRLSAELLRALGLAPDALQADVEAEKAEAREALRAAKRVLGERPVAICQSATTRPLGLAKRLLDAGIRVTDVFADMFLTGDRAAFDALRASHPELAVHPVTTPEMRFSPRRFPDGLVAIGQKAAWFTGAKHMVNLIEGGPYWGHGGVAALARRLAAAAEHEADVASIIRIKGYGCLGGVCASEEGWI